MKKFLVLGFVLASFGVADRAHAQEGPADEASAFFGQEARYGHRVYGAVMLNVGR